MLKRIGLELWQHIPFTAAGAFIGIGAMALVTVFDTPIVNQFFHGLALFFLKVLGWRREGHFPRGQKCVLIAAPHTSNWDLFYTLCLAFAFRVKPYWMGKDALFRFPFGGVLRWLGGIPIDRSKANDMVSQSIQAFEDLGARYFIPTQWGAFQLGDNPPGFPMLDLKRALARLDRDPETFLIMDVGQIKLITPRD